MDDKALSDLLRQQGERAVVPHSLEEKVLRDSKRRRFMIAFVSVAGVAIIVVGIAFAALQPQERRLGPAEGPQDLDAKATSLREKLGPLCAEFDFQLKEKAGEGVVRPIHCERRGSDEVHLKLYVFSDEQAREAWQKTYRAEMAEGAGVIIRSEDWIATSRDQDIARQVADRLLPDSTENVAAPGRFDELTITLELKASSVQSGGEVGSSLTVRNDSGETIVDPSCLIGAGRYALVPVDDPDAELWLQPVVDCSGTFKMADGFMERSAGPTFLARTKHGEALPPGEYTATLEIEGYSERLEEPIKVTD